MNLIERFTYRLGRAYFSIDLWGVVMKMLPFELAPVLIQKSKDRYANMLLHAQIRLHVKLLAIYYL